MAANEIEIAIYNEGCTLAGRSVATRILEECDGDWSDCGDWSVYSGSPAELLKLAELQERNSRSGGGGSYDRRVVDTIREAVYAVEPDLRPQPPEEPEGD